jgi:phage host-nuclease inhibitor protein Gam
MYYDPRVERKAHHICHCIGENEGIILSDKSRSDIFLTTRAVANYWKEECDELRRLNHAKRWNELTLWLNRHPNVTVKQIQMAMEMLNKGEYIRDFNP